ncbi:hypothetical protein B9J78_02625 [bacterium Unc6]|nr:hypothetical protein [bacterium Unc6]
MENAEKWIYLIVIVIFVISTIASLLNAIKEKKSSAPEGHEGWTLKDIFKVIGQEEEVEIPPQKQVHKSTQPVNTYLQAKAQGTAQPSRTEVMAGGIKTEEKKEYIPVKKDCVAPVHLKDWLEIESVESLRKYIIFNTILGKPRCKIGRL